MDAGQRRERLPRARKVLNNYFFGAIKGCLGVLCVFARKYYFWMNTSQEPFREQTDVASNTLALEKNVG
jgi:hypothetical protein